MMITTWQMVGKSMSLGPPEIRTYVLAGEALGCVDEGYSEVNLVGGGTRKHQFTVGHIEYFDTIEEARAEAVHVTELLENQDYELARTPDFAEIEWDVDDWHLAEYRATDAGQIASAIYRLRERVLNDHLHRGTIHHVTVGPKEPTGSLSIGSLWIHTDADDPEHVRRGPFKPTVPAGEGLSYSASKGFTISMDIDKVDPEVLRILVGDANTIQPMSLGIESTVQPMSLETDGD